MKVAAVGAHVLDTLVRPVAEIPDGQGGALVEQIVVTAAGPAGGTAVVLAKLGAEVTSVGCIGTDAVGDFLLTLLQKHGVDTSGLVRRDGVQTSASVLPIRPDGSRPAFHVVGANLTFGPDDVGEAVQDKEFLHLGAPELMGGEAAARILEGFAGVTSMDSLASGDPGVLAWIAPAFPHLDWVLPNAEQVRGWTGLDDLVDGCRALLDLGARGVAVTDGAAGATVVTAGDVVSVPARAVEVVDTTGCGDAFSAGFLRGLSLGRSPADAARLGCAVAGEVARGLGSDFGAYDLASVLALLD